MKRRFASICLCVLACTAAVFADGGTLRVSRVCGSYRVTIFTSPEPLRVGPADVSVVVCDASSGVEISDSRVTLQLVPIGHASGGIRRIATRESSPTGLFQMASFDFDTPGRWMLETEIDSPLGHSRVGAEIVVLPPLPRWIDLAGWIVLPVLPIGLFTAREYRRAKRG